MYQKTASELVNSICSPSGFPPDTLVSSHSPKTWIMSDGYSELPLGVNLRGTRWCKKTDCKKQTMMMMVVMVTQNRSN